MLGCEKSQPQNQANGFSQRKAFVARAMKNQQVDADPFNEHPSLHILCHFYICWQKWAQCMDLQMGPVYGSNNGRCSNIVFFFSVAILDSHINDHTDYHRDCHMVILYDLLLQSLAILMPYLITKRYFDASRYNFDLFLFDLNSWLFLTSHNLVPKPSTFRIIRHGACAAHLFQTPFSDRMVDIST